MDFALGLDNGQRFRVNAYFQRGLMAAALRAIHLQYLNPMTSISQTTSCSSAISLMVSLGCWTYRLSKSTTLACMIDQINKKRSCRIITVEDLIEFTHKNAATIDQREVYTDTKSLHP